MLIELAKKERDAAALAMAGCARELEAAEKQLTVLREYRAEYGRRQDKALSQGAKADVARSYRTFIERIEVALKQAEADVDRAQGKLATAQTRLAETQRRVQSLETLEARKEAELRIAANRQDQKQNDELANQAALRNPGAWRVGG